MALVRSTNRPAGRLSDSQAPRAGIEGLPRFLTLTDVRQLAGGVSRTTVYAWIAAGRLPKSRKLGPRRVGWAASEIEAWALAKMAE